MGRPVTRSTPDIVSFAAGEIDPRLVGRKDLAWYGQAARELRNMVALPHGPAERRPGTRDIAAAHSSSTRSKLWPFVYSDVASYLIEMGAGALRFFADRGQIRVAATDAAITNGDFTAGITGWTDQSTSSGAIAHDATNGRLNLVGAASSLAIAEQAPTTTATGVVHVLRFRVFGVHGDAATVRVGSSSGASDLLADTACGVGAHALEFTPAASPFYIQFENAAAKILQVDDVALIDDAALEIWSPYSEAEQRGIRITQSADLLYLTHRDHWPMTLSRLGNRSWQLVEQDVADGPYLPENVETGRTLAPAATTGLGINVTASGHSPFAATDVGRWLTIKHSSTWGAAVIVEYTSPTVVKVDIRTDFAATTAQSAWKLGAWSETTGYPKAVTFNEERLTFADIRFVPGRFDGSKSADFQTFTPGTADDDPISNQIAANKVNLVEWMKSGRRLLIGTQGQEVRVGPDSASGPLTPTSVRATPETHHGSADMDAIQTAAHVLFLQRSRRKVRELAYNYASDGYEARDVSVRAGHLFRQGGGIYEAAFQEEPWPIVWFVRADGMLVGLTYEPTDPIIAGHRHWIADGRGLVESVAVIPAGAASATGNDEVWASILYQINGAPSRRIQLLEDYFDDDAPIDDAFFVDSGLTLDNTIDATLTPGAGATVAGTTGVIFTAGSSVFVAGDVGRFIRYRYRPDVVETPDLWLTAVAEITGYTSGTAVTATVHVAFPSTAAIAAAGWRMTVTSVSGADHLEGESVALLVDGAVQASQTVTGGTVELPAPGATIQLGLAATARIKTNRFEAASREGSSQTKKQRINKVAVRFHRTGEGASLSDGIDSQVIPLREAGDAMDAAVPLKTGDVVFPFQGRHDPDQTLLIEQVNPLPMTVVLLQPQVVVHEG